MKQLLQSLKTGELGVEEVPIPELQPDGVLVRNHYSFISTGTEKSKVDVAKKSLIGKALDRPDQVKKVIQTFKKEGLASTYQKVMSKLEAPAPLGYSSAGEVVAVGDCVTEFMVGDYVACGGAGFANHAEMIYVPKNLCVKIPREVDLAHAAVTTVGSIALQGIRQADIRFGENVTVLGLGLLGQLTVQMLKAAGCTVLAVDLDKEKAELSKELGADFIGVIGLDDIQRIAHQITAGNGMDAVIIPAATSSNSPIEMAGDICRKKGRVVVVGAVKMDIPRSPYYEKEIDVCLSCSYGPGRYDVNYEEKGIDYPFGYVRWTEQRNMAHVINLLANGSVKMDKILTHVIDFKDAEKAYDMVLGKTNERFMGILFKYDHNTPVQNKVVLRSEKIISTNTVNLGVIGAGNFAKGVLLPVLKKHSKVNFTGVMTATGSGAKGVAQNFGFKYCASDVSDIINDNETNTVMIATRHDTHSELVVKALNNNQNVFVEKPLAMNEKELSEVAKAWQNANSILMVGFNRRFSPLAVKMKEFFARRVGPMVMNYQVNAGAIPADHWIQDPKQGGGRIIGEGCHFIDLMQYLTGALPVKVYAEAVDTRSSKNLLDTLNITIKFSDGSVGTLSYLANGDAAYPKEKFEVFCDGSVAVIDDFKVLTTVRSGKNSNVKSSQDKGHAAELEAFIQAVINGGTLPINFESMLATTLATFKIHESLRTGNSVTVDINLFLSSNIEEKAS